ncbi:interleukin-18 receptor 1-like isoform X2 [Heptranchias perlo]|uniref:interleukin-18 receptor 1-like isoform X2 n=1 Tax=Heptranchias perlo TaxID=212740 RepID=UPI003559D835
MERKFNMQGEWINSSRLIVMLQMFLLTFTISETMNRCINEDGLTTIFALEGEYARLRCRVCNGSTPLVMSDFQTHGFTITWFKDTYEGGLVELLGKTGRITFEGSLLEFWPATVNDSGRYNCSVFNGTHNIMDQKKLSVTPINEGCYNEEIVFSWSGIIGSSTELYCPKMDEYRNNKEDLKWYKDCQKFVHKGSSLVFKKLNKENAGYYTCKLSFEHSGVQYNITRTLNLILKGESRTINCTVIAGNRKKSQMQLSWRFKDSHLTNCNQEQSVCQDSKRAITKENRTYVVSPLVFTQIKEEHLNQYFNCVFVTSKQKANGYIILQEKGKSNVHGIVELLISIIVVLIIVAIICVHFNVQIVLCYRDLTGKDETLGDSKEYDAYVLLLKSDETLHSAQEEQQFALELLPAILEEQFGYRLCIFERDVPPGGASADNILFYINNCRRLIIILSKEYVDDEYSSTYELMTGLHQVLVERKIKPILIEFKPIKSTKSLSESLQLVLRSKRTVKWKGSKSVFKHSYFWKKVRYLMPAKGGQLVNHSQGNY